MRITLSAIHVETADSLWVDFDSAFGEGCGRWLGAPPQVAQVHEVELNLEEQFLWNHNLWAALRNEPHIKRDRQGLLLTGELLRREDDVVALAIGPSVVLLSLQDAPAQLPRFLSLVAREISLYPVEL